MGSLAEHRPDTLRAAGALNEAGGVAMELAGRRFYPIQVAEKGFEVFRIRVHGTWGHGSMPREDNALVLAAEAVRRLATPGEPRLTRPMRQFLDGIAADRGHQLCLLLRDSISPDVLHAGIKYNVIPGEAVLEIDCRTLPGTTPEDMREEVRARLGDLAPQCTLEHVIGRPPVENPQGDLYELLAATIRAHDPDAIPLPVMTPFATDAKTTALRLGIPTYGFTPLRLDPEERFLARYHGVDERVGLDALRWGLPVLYDVVAAYCG